MFRVPDLLLATVAQLAPVAEIDCTSHPPAGGLPGPYRLVMTITFASGKTETVPFAFAAVVGPDDAAEAFFVTVDSDDWVSWRKDLKVYVAAGGGSAVRKLTIESTGFVPAVRWWPMAPKKPKPRK